MNQFEKESLGFFPTPLHKLTNMSRELGKKVYKIPCGGSNALGTLGYIDCMKEIADSGQHFDHIVCAGQAILFLQKKEMKRLL